MSKPKHILLSSLGTNPRPATYELKNRHESSNISAIGLYKLLDAESRPDEIWFIRTSLAKQKSWDTVEREAADAGLCVKAIELPDEHADDTRQFLDRAANEIPLDCCLTLDVSAGLRHHAFLFYALALYLTTFHRIRIKGVWYCRFETREPDDLKPVIDLKPVLELADWFNALSVFQKAGLTQEMAELVKSQSDDLRQAAATKGNRQEDHQLASRLKKVADAMESHSFAYSTGLPLELGKASNTLAREMEGFADSEMGRRLPLANQLQERIVEQARKTQFDTQPRSKGKWKESVALTAAELHRQGNMINSYLERGQLSLAMGLMREWVVSWLMLKEGKTNDWLQYKNRKPFEQQLGSLSEIEKLQSDEFPLNLASAQKDFAVFWSKLSDSLRNTLHHHGMRPDSMEGEPRKQLDDVRDFWQGLLHSVVDLSVGGGHGALLICPIGLTPGVLYSALCRMNPAPSRVAIVCSPETQSSIAEALSRSEAEVEHKELILQDIHRGVNEFDAIESEVLPWLLESDEVHICLTGGTTLMGALVSKLAQRANRFQIPVKRFVLIDSRSPQDQRDDPWQLGDRYDLE